ncbi:MAG: HAD-IIIA family hydrolase [Lachnospiraceae bacterium]|nr:HAD-IIIA family hydrolase [Lachnospiraceae bacterium]
MKSTNKGATDVIFLDRDGVISRKMPLHCHVLSPDEFEVLPDVYEALRLIIESGYITLVITNQRCLALGTLDDDGFSRINDKMVSELTTHGVYVDGLYYCPHGNDEGCGCRKPEPGLLEEASYDLGRLGITIDRSRSWMIGDDETDIIAGKRFGVNTVKIGDDVPDLLAAVRMITGTR